MRALKRILVGGVFCLPVVTGVAGHYFVGVVGGLGVASGVSDQRRAFLGADGDVRFSGGDKNKVGAVFGVTNGYDWSLLSAMHLRLGVSLLHFFETKHEGIYKEGGLQSTAENTYTFKTSRNVITTDAVFEYNPASWWVAPFLRASLGYSVNEAKDFDGTYSSLEHELHLSDRTTGSFAYGVGLGIRSHFDLPVNFSVEYDYWSLGEAKLGGGGMFPIGMHWRLDGVGSGSQVQTLLFSVEYKIK